MKTITVRYGTSSRNHTCDTTATTAQVLADPSNRLVLGYGDNVQGLVSGVVISGDTIIPDGATLNVENKANQKS
jgi:hypothetical protein